MARRGGQRARCIQQLAVRAAIRLHRSSLITAAVMPAAQAAMPAASTQTWGARLPWPQPEGPSVAIPSSHTAGGLQPGGSAQQLAALAGISEADFADFTQSDFTDLTKELGAVILARVELRKSCVSKQHGEGRVDDAAPELLTATSDEAALLIACYLTNPIDLLHLALVCRRYAAKSFGAASPNPVGAVAAVGPDEWWSLVDESARRWLAQCSEQEQGWVPRQHKQTWLSAMRELQVLQQPLTILTSLGMTVVPDDDGSLVVSDVRHLPPNQGETLNPFAASTTVMRAGRHYAEFTEMWGPDGPDGTDSSSTGNFGVVPPSCPAAIHQQPPGGDGFLGSLMPDESCFYWAHDGSRFPGYESGNRMIPFGALLGDRIGLLLDLDAGTMHVYNNDRLQGELQNGLSGRSFCWAIETSDEAGASIIRKPGPPPPTAADMDEAEASWEQQ
jgi:hypothetical protein